MTTLWKSLLPIVLLSLATACSHGRYSATSFKLPPDGDVNRGKAAFVAEGCSGCHQVTGVDLPAPTVQPAIPAVLGGMALQRVSDAYLVTSIIHPSYELAPYPQAAISSHGKSLMPSYADRLTVRQLTDIVAFLQAQYAVPRREPIDVTH